MGERGGRDLGWKREGEAAGGAKERNEGGDFGGVEVIVRGVGEDEVEGGGGGGLGGGVCGGGVCGGGVYGRSGEGGNGGLDDLGVGEASDGEDGAEILAEGADDGGGLLDEGDVGSAAAEGFEAEGARAGVGV